MLESGPRVQSLGDWYNLWKTVCIVYAIEIINEVLRSLLKKR